MDGDTNYGVGFSWIFVPGPEPAGDRSEPADKLETAPPGPCPRGPAGRAQQR